MYTLQRHGEIFEIHEEGPVYREEKGRSGVVRREPTRSAPKQRPQYDQWKRFVETGQLRGPRLDKVLLASWKRCRDWEVDPSPRSCWDFTSIKQLEPFATRLNELAKDIEKRTYQAIQGKNLLITMTDSNARVVRTWKPCSKPTNSISGPAPTGRNRAWAPTPSARP